VHKWKEIGDKAFDNSGLKAIRIPNNVENIGNDCLQSSDKVREKQEI
jgi:hypothetical protein